MPRNSTAKFLKSKEKGRDSQTVNSLCERLVKFPKMCMVVLTSIVILQGEQKVPRRNTL